MQLSRPESTLKAESAKGQEEMSTQDEHEGLVAAFSVRTEVVRWTESLCPVIFQLVGLTVRAAQ